MNEENDLEQQSGIQELLENAEYNVQQQQQEEGGTSEPTEPVQTTPTLVPPDITNATEHSLIAPNMGPPSADSLPSPQNEELVKPPEDDGTEEAHWRDSWDKKNFWGSDFSRTAGDIQELAAAPGAGLLDFGIDAASRIFGQEQLNTDWDRWSRLRNPIAQKIRRFSSIVLPNMLAYGRATQALNASQLPWLAKGTANIVSASAISTAVMGLSDENQEDNVMRTFADTWPNIFGTNGSHPIPEDWQTLDSDSSSVRAEKNMLEEAGLSVVGDMLGFFLGMGKPLLNWFRPKDDLAKAWKTGEAFRHADIDTVAKIAEIDEALATNPKPEYIEILTKQKQSLLEQLSKTGTSPVTTLPLESHIQRNAISRAQQTEEVAIDKIKTFQGNNSPILADPDIKPNLSRESATARVSIPPGNVARNMGDTAAIKGGFIGPDSVPAPLLTDSMQRKGLAIGKSRKAVAGLMEGAKELGNFDTVVDGFRFSRNQMDEAAWSIYNSIMQPGSTKNLKRLFASQRDIKHLVDGTQIKYATEAQAMAAGFAMRDLVDIYLGRNIAVTSARVMDTLGREISNIGQASIKYYDIADDDRLMTMALDKLEFLMSEYGVNKYISGWQLQNKNWFNRLSTSADPANITTMLKQEFDMAVSSKQASAKKVRQALEGLKETNPEAIAPLMEAFAYSNGDVDTIAKLYKWAEDQISISGFLVSPDPKRMNLFARGAWSVVYNNVLSGLAASKAAVGNGFKLMIQPVESLLGHGIEAVIQGDLEPVKRSLYYHGAAFETTRRALGDAWSRVRKVNESPEEFLQSIRKDFVIKEDSAWDIVDGMSEVWEKEGNKGALFQYNWAKASKDVANMKALRWGMTAMSGIDAATDTFQATKMSRLKAYDDVLTNGGHDAPEMLLKAEQTHYATMFDKHGLLTDVATKNASGEVALNLDDRVTSWINTATEAVPALKLWFMFPRTGNNQVKLASSYTPLMAIPGLNKYAKVLRAGNDIDKIKVALAEHGIKSFENTPNAMAIYKNLQAEYRGRLALSSMTSLSLFNYALGGNIRGNGPVNASERQKLRDQGFLPKTINIAGKWVSYDGIPLLDPTLTLLGDLGYYADDIGSSMTEEILDKLAWSMSATFINNTPLYGIEPFLAAMNGDESAWQRMTAQLVRGAIPMSGTLGVVSNAITSSQKDIYKDFQGYVKNRLPVFSSTLPERYDIWTGEPINDIDNHLLRFLNALSPVKVSGTQEPWRAWLLRTGWDGVSLITRTSSGGVEYTAEQRELITKYMGEEQMYKQIERIMKNKAYNEQINKVRELRRRGIPFEEIKLNEQKLPVFHILNKIVADAKLRAEFRLMRENPELEMNLIGQKRADNLMEQGRVDEAAESIDNTQNRIKQLMTIKK